eukprot:jgi/Orpsp1_1/1177361/evm.model.c7180000061144.1
MEYEINEQSIKNLKLNTLFYNTINTLTNALEELLQSKKIQEVYGKIYNSSIPYNKKSNYKKHPKNNFKFSFNKQYKINPSPSSSILSKRKRHYEDIIYKESKSQRLSNYLSNHLREMNVQSYPNSQFQAEKNSKLNYEQKKYFINEKFNKNTQIVNEIQNQQFNQNIIPDKNTLNDLSNKFNYDLYINRSVDSIYQWMEYQKEKLGMNEEEYKKEWEFKKKKLEYNISIFENSGLKDSYDDMRSIIQEIIITLEFLSGGCVEELKELIPAWKKSHYYIFSALNYVQIIEDMKEFISTSYEMNESFDIFFFNLKEMLKDKKEKYGDILKTNGRYWRSMCFPFNENLIMEVNNRIYSYLYISHLKINQILDENNIYQCNYDPKNSVIIKWIDSLYDLLQLTEDCFEFINESCPNNLIEQLLISIIFYLKHSLYLLKSNSIIILNDSSTSKTKNEAQYFALFENSLQILKILNTICSKNSDIFFNMLNIINKNSNIQFNPFNKHNSINNQIDIDNDQSLLKLKKLTDLLPQIITELGINLFLQIPNINNISRIKMSISLSYKYIKLISEIIVNNLEKINEIRKQEHQDKEEFIFNNIINTPNLQNETNLSNESNTNNFNFDDSDGLILNSTSSSCSSYIDSNFDLDWRVSNKNCINNNAK